VSAVADLKMLPALCASGNTEGRRLASLKFLKRGEMADYRASVVKRFRRDDLTVPGSANGRAVGARRDCIERPAPSTLYAVGAEGVASSHKSARA
jgi:hypothetical protein